LGGPIPIAHVAVSLYTRPYTGRHSIGENPVVTFLHFVWKPLELDRPRLDNISTSLLKPRSIFTGKMAKQNATRKPQPQPSEPSSCPFWSGPPKHMGTMNGTCSHVLYAVLFVKRGKDAEYIVFYVSYVSGGNFSHAMHAPLRCLDAHVAIGNPSK
jgi:hypothetical protein